MASSASENSGKQYPKVSEEITTSSGRKFVINPNTPELPDEPLPSETKLRHEVATIYSEQEQKAKKKRGFVSFAFELALIFLVVWGIRSFVAAPFQVEGHSMDDTLYHKEKIFINKIDTYLGTIDRGDIIVFKPPYYKMVPKKGPICFLKQQFSKETDLAQLCGEEPQHYVKRVIGIGGDTVEISGGKVFLTSEGGEKSELEENYLNAENKGNTCIPSSCIAQRRTDSKEFVVPEGKVFVLGDNRTHSTDSRAASEVGSAFNDGTPNPFVPLENIVGTVKLVIWPPSRWQWFSGENKFLSSS